jgi:DNA-binding NarL/FixJ family response regulator
MYQARDSEAAVMQNNDGVHGNPRASVRILLADDNMEILDHVGGMLDSDYEVIGKIADGALVCAQVKSLKPDLIILDISMGDHSGILLAYRLREQGYTGEIIFLTVHEDPDFVSAAIGAGGRGYIIKTRIGSDLKVAIKTVLAKQIFISAPLKQ